jgi:hypothetical protein
MILTIKIVYLDNIVFLITSLLYFIFINRRSRCIHCGRFGFPLFSFVWIVYNTIMRDLRKIKNTFDGLVPWRTFFVIESRCYFKILNLLLLILKWWYLVFATIEVCQTAENIRFLELLLFYRTTRKSRILRHVQISDIAAERWEWRDNFHPHPICSTFLFSIFSHHTSLTSREWSSNILYAVEEKSGVVYVCQVLVVVVVRRKKSIIENYITLSREQYCVFSRATQNIDFILFLINSSS